MAKKIKNKRNGQRHPILTGLIIVVAIVCGAVGVLAALSSNIIHATNDSVDEIHYSFGNTSDSVVFDWHGQEQNIYYGPDTNYGYVGLANNSAVTPVDSAGPFREVQLTGLTPGTTYHYKIGTNGLDHTFQTNPTGDFTWADVGDTGSTLCDPWEAQIHALIASQNPTFVTHGGDITYANQCGVAAVHQYYLDQQIWSESAAFQPVWGNHEYGQPNSDEGEGTPPPGTPRDSMGNYKGRSFVTNSQTVPNDTKSQINNPGCGWETGSQTNTCMGEDWGWFQTGHVLFISYPEPWPNDYPTWQATADQLMANAQANPTIDFVITYGHRPAYSSSTTDINTNVQTALNNLALKYSPSSANPNGKYILNVNHHVHWEEVFSPINNLVNITNGGGGAGQASPTPIASNSIYHLTHPAILVGHYSASQHTLTVNLLCGPAFTPNPKTTCTYGSVLYTQTFSSSNTGPIATTTPTSTPTPTANPTPTPTIAPTLSGTQRIGNQSVETDMTGWTGVYGGSPYVSVTRDSGAAHSGSYSLKVTGLTGASNLSSGFNDNPRWVTNTVAGTTYTQSAWVDPTFIGQKISLRLREWKSSTLVTDKVVTVTAATTGWQQLSQTLTAAGTGNQLSFAVYASISAGQYFYADDFSLTTQQ